MAFVASRFAPGQRSIRVQLVPQILNTLRLRHGISRRSEDDKWMFLQALGILYAWASPLPLERISDDDAINAQLSHTDLKALVESTALTLSLHRSADDVAELVWNEKEIRDSLALRKYLFWLWLYTLAHRYSLLTSTPPTIPEDTTIKLAPDLLKNLIDDHYVGRIMSEIDLSLLWRQAGLHQHGLGEWWCLLSPNDINIPSALAVIGDLTKALDIWSERWCPAGGLNMDIRFMFITFNYRFSRFCISTYFVRILRSISAEKMPYSTQLNYVLESVRAAVTFCGYILELPPLTIDYGRYLADTAFVKIAYACEFVLRGCEILHTNPDYDDLRSSLNTVKDVALLMHQLAVDEVHCAKFYGQALLEKVHDFEKRLQSGPVAWERSPASTQDTSYQPAQDLHSPESRSGGLFSDLIKEFAAEAAFIDPFLLQ
ncbi:hypothetical protein N7466_000287 [Penicillium verhagenii]|uniref:uncharacterized protein n=1 Tax=Penicillium verhagenii TaxID=1562060 RepID=UPI002545AD1C|nr:uncharacterized protein N7466_000287 [Penicillium verhagenii]KAJ5947272.1 hypothetical protein N7466_000287 [Penicillium verhagenii]